MRPGDGAGSGDEMGTLSIGLMFDTALVFGAAMFEPAIFEIGAVGSLGSAR